MAGRVPDWDRDARFSVYRIWRSQLFQKEGKEARGERTSQGSRGGKRNQASGSAA